MANESLRRVNTSGGNRRVFTWSAWVKRSIITSSGNAALFSGANPTFNTSGQQEFILYMGTGDDFSVNIGTSGVVQDGLITTTQKFRDSGNWFHLIVAFDSTKVTSADRVKIYLNGNLITDFSASSYPSRNYDTSVNRSGFTANVGGKSATGNEWLGEMTDVFFVDGQALTPDVFGFYKQGKGYISVGSTQATDFRPGQWVPKTPRVIKTEIIRRGGFGVNGFYLPMNDSKNFGADFHCDPNSIITLNEKLPQPRVGVATTASVGLGYTDALRADPYAANLVLALPFVSGGLQNGFGDYSHIIRGSGSAKSIVSTSATIANVSAGSTSGLYYGSGASFSNSGIGVSFASSSDFAFGTGDYTVECWIHRSNASSSSGSNGIWTIGTVNNVGSLTLFYEDASFMLRSRGTGDALYTNDFSLTSSNFSTQQWNHFAVCRKGTTVTLYVNGVAAGISTTSTRNVDTNPFIVGSINVSGLYPFFGFIQDLRVYKGVAKYTGGFDVPKPYTPVGIATWRAVPDTTTNNFATMNPLIGAVPRSGGTVTSTIVTYTDGNLTTRNSANAGYAPAMQSHSNVGMTTGKWYWEASNFSTTSNEYFGISKGNEQITPNGSATGTECFLSYYATGSLALNGQYDGSYRISATLNNSPGTAISSTNDVIGFAFDVTNSSLSVYRNGVLNNTATGIAATSNIREWFITKGAAGSGTGSGMSWNFGQNPTFSGNTTAGTFTDSNSKGLFKYQPPSGFLSLCEDNLPTPAISNPGQYFRSVLWTGDGNTTKNVVGVGFTPDLVWMKGRTSTSDHSLIDSVRGKGVTSLSSNQTYADNDFGLKVLSFDSDGFSTGTGSINFSYANTSGQPYVAWCWRAGAGTTSTNTNGSITSVVSVNQDAGFSVVSYTGNNTSGATVGHGLGKTPAMIVIKARTATTPAGNWIVLHKGNTPISSYSNSSTFTLSGYNNVTLLNSTLAQLNYGFDAQVNGTSSNNYVAYCWAEIEGFSKFGSWVSNANADGPFIYCGFKPALVICKTASGDVSNWVIADSSRSSVNDGSTSSLRANTSDTEATAAGGFTIDFLSNGFKLRQSGALNSTGLTNIFAAWAESPFQTANSK
jgi:hypothetical protein